MVGETLLWLGVAAITAIAMDLWSILLHGRLWHGPLWAIHASHHTKRRGRFELNDLLSGLHAPIAIALILYGSAGPGSLRAVAFGVGIGMTAFGLAYVIVHDGLVHKRLPARALRAVPYLRAVARDHLVHHAGTEGGVPYGLFLGPLELARHRRLKRSRSASMSRSRGASGA